MSELWAVVTVGTRETYLSELLNSLSYCSGRVVFLNNKVGYTKYEGVHHVEDYGEVNIYRWWNNGLDYVVRNGGRYVLVLNDDLRFDSNYPKSIHEYTVQSNLALVDTHGTGNNGGTAWLLDTSYGYRLDERFRWWYGDTELFNRVSKDGKFERWTYSGYLEHCEPNGSLVKYPYLQQLVQQDEELYRSLTT